MSRFVCSTMLAAFAVTGGAGDASADIVVPGTRKIPVEVHVDLGGDFRDRTILEHIVQPGDTLIGLAREHLGDEERLDDIRRLNPGRGDTIRPGETVLLPPKDRRASQLHFFTAPLIGRGAPLHFRTSGEIPDHHYGQWLMAVEGDHLGEFLAVGDDWMSLQRAEEPPDWIHFTTSPLNTRTTIKDSLFTKGKKKDVAHFRVSRVADGEIVLASVERDAKGSSPPKKAMLQGGLAALALLGLILLARRRRA